MGDHNAVDIAQEAHLGVLRASGALRESERLRYDRPLPSAPDSYYAGVVVDDFCGVQVFPEKGWRKERLTRPGRDRDAFAAAAQGYARVGLTTHPKKQVTREATFTAWGGQVEGVEGLVGSSPPPPEAQCPLGLGGLCRVGGHGGVGEPSGLLGVCVPVPSSPFRPLFLRVLLLPPRWWT